MRVLSKVIGVSILSASIFAVVGCGDQDNKTAAQASAKTEVQAPAKSLNQLF